jgi:ABC-type sugar transport system ATPase subunit
VSAQPHANSRPTPSATELTYAAFNICKSFSGVVVLTDASVEFRAGEIHTLLGENGAGKSTLLKIMAGVYSHDAGELLLNGESLRGLSPRDAQRRGIYLVPQEPRLMPDLSVAENVYLGALPRGVAKWNVAWRSMAESAHEHLSAVGLNISPRSLAGDLSLAQQQLVECARALAHGCQVVFFDEPTSPLTAHEAARLFDLMQQLRADGLALGFISHRLDEVEEISDRLTVLRDGRIVGREERGSISRAEMTQLMVGRELSLTTRSQRSVPTTARAVLDVRGLASPPQVKEMTLHVRAGEVVGLAGLVGSGRTEFAEAVFGLRASTGTVMVDERRSTRPTPRKSIDRGLVYLAEDRGRNGVFADVELTRNVTASTVRRIPRTLGALLRLSEERRQARDALHETKVKASTMAAPIKTLSGGNQQRALFARWILAGPKVAILDEPTRGVDVGAKEGIYQIIEQLAEQGVGTLVISSEMEELIRLCDRVYVAYEGRITGELVGDEISLESMGRLAVGAM